MISKFLAKFSILDLVIVALFSACGVAGKPFVRILSQMMVGTLVPAGTVGGVFYMLWIVLACSVVGKRGTAVQVGIVQSVLVVFFDMLGNRGLANILVYVLPGIALEAVMLLAPRYIYGWFTAFLAGMTANTAGALIVGFLFLRLPSLPLMVSLAVAAVSGGIGGVIGYRLSLTLKAIKKLKRAK